MTEPTTTPSLETDYVEFVQAWRAAGAGALTSEQREQLLAMHRGLTGALKATNRLLGREIEITVTHR